MSRALILIAAFLFFRAVLPRTPRSSPTTITPYMNALDGIMTAQQVSSVLDEVMPYELWLASHRAKVGKIGDDKYPPDSAKTADPAVTSSTSHLRKR